jgi:hypothetical protein
MMGECYCNENITIVGEREKGIRRKAECESGKDKKNESFRA